MARGSKLSLKHQRFADEWLVDGNATRAYKAAGFRAKNDDVAKACGARLLASANVAAYVAAAQEKASKKLGLTREWVLGGLKQNFERAMQAEQVLDSEGMPTGEYRYEGAVANKSLELVGKSLGLFAEKVEHTVAVSFAALVAESQKEGDE